MKISLKRADAVFMGNKGRKRSEKVLTVVAILSVECMGVVDARRETVEFELKA